MEYFLSKKELRANSLNCDQVLSSALPFSFFLSIYLFSVSYDFFPDILLQLPFFLFMTLHFSLWSQAILLCASRSKRLSLPCLVLGVILILFIKASEKIVHDWDFPPAFFWIVKLSPFANLALGSLSVYLRRNFFFLLYYMDFEAGMALLVIYCLIIDCLIYLCCSPRRAPSRPGTIININRGCYSISKISNFVLKTEKDAIDEIERERGSLLLPSLTPLECLVYAARYKNIPSRQALFQIDKLLNLFSLSRNRNKLMRELSVGEQKKVLIGMELIGGPSHLYF